MIYKIVYYSNKLKSVHNNKWYLFIKETDICKKMLWLSNSLIF